MGALKPEGVFKGGSMGIPTIGAFKGGAMRTPNLNIFYGGGGEGQHRPSKFNACKGGEKGPKPPPNPTMEWGGDTPKLGTPAGGGAPRGPPSARAASRGLLKGAERGEVKAFGVGRRQEAANLVRSFRRITAIGAALRKAGGKRAENHKTGRKEWEKGLKRAECGRNSAG